MPIALDSNDEPLEAALTALGKKQPRPLSKTAMLRAVAWAAVRVCQATGDPMAWEATSLSTRNGPNFSQSANESVRTDTEPPAKAVEPIDVNDPAAAKVPPSGPPQQSANSDEAKAPAA